MGRVQALAEDRNGPEPWCKHGEGRGPQEQRGRIPSGCLGLQGNQTGKTLDFFFFFFSNPGDFSIPGMLVFWQLTKWLGEVDGMGRGRKLVRSQAGEQVAG